jgi:hypothetical protein
MTKQQVIAALDTDEAQGTFADVKNKKSARGDLHALMLMDSLLPDHPAKDVISAVEHGHYFVCFDLDDLAPKLNTELCKELRRCGLRYDEQCESLYFWV